jgi:peptidoglycan hydrolase-like protein with peptidoglycan-binding domain
MHERKVKRPAAPAAPAAAAAPAAPAPPAAPAAPAKVHPTIRAGARGTDVVEAQVKLKNKGYLNDPVEGELQADGWFGPKTQKIVTFFQKEKGLAEDGVIGPKTWAALDDGGYTGHDDKVDPKEQREFQFHEVGGGTTMWIPEDDIRQGVMTGPGYATVTSLEIPSTAPPSKDKKKAVK